jgi:antibiotic biosynthesis monooxygenase (ABM) superfamily enzyme
MSAAYYYIVRYWVAPAAEARLLAWLDGGHTAEMVAQPGFLSARRVRFAETDSLGWHAFATFYALESKVALDAYFASAIRERFGREAAIFAGAMRSGRSWGAGEYRTQRGREGPLDAPYVHLVRFWTAPAAEAHVLEWLDGKHAAELVARPDHLWAQRIRLAETDSLGWSAFHALYGLESKAALDAYLDDPVRARFAREQTPFAGAMRVERSRGACEFVTAHEP